MRVVLDTNVLISAALKPGGLEAAVVDRVIAGGLEAWVTPEVWAEYQEVAARPKFVAVRDALDLILAQFETRICRTSAAGIGTPRAIDEDDNCFIDCAAAAEADYLVTGNLRHYPPEWGRTRAVNARGLWDLLRA